MKYFITIFLVAAVLASKNVMSQNHIDKHDSTIHSVYSNSSGDLLIKVNGVSGWLQIGKAGEDAADVMYSTALAAKMSNSKTWIRYIPRDGNHGLVAIINIK